MKSNLIKRAESKPPIKYSREWFDLYTDKSLHELYSDFLKSNHWDKEAFFIDLSIHLKPFYEVAFNNIQHPSEHYLFNLIKGEQTRSMLEALKKEDLNVLYEKTVHIYREIHLEQIKNLTQKRSGIGSLNNIKVKIKSLLEECFNKTVNTSALLCEELVINDKIYRFADPKSVLNDIIDESIKKENFYGDTFSLSHGKSTHFIDKINEIAIKHTVHKLDELPIEEKTALIPLLESSLTQEQNLKVAKNYNYKGIEGFEEFLKTFLERFEKEQDKYIEKTKTNEDKTNKLYLKIGTTDDEKSKEEIENKQRKFKNLFIGLKHKFSDNPTAPDFESLFNPNVKYHKKFNWIGDKEEFFILLKFLDKKEIVRQTKINITLMNRFLINGERLPNTNILSVTKSKIKLDKKSEWIKTLNGYLE